MKKMIIIPITIIICFLIINIPKIYAEEPYGLSNYYNTETNEIIKKYLLYLKQGNKKAYNYIDQNNEELKKNTKKYLGRVDVQYIITDIQEVDGKITAKVSIYAKSTKYDDETWHTSGDSYIFVISKDDSENLKIIETNIFKNFFLDDIARVIKAIGAIISIIIFSVVAAIIIKSNKKKENMYNTYNQYPQNTPNLNQ